MPLGDLALLTAASNPVAPGRVRGRARARGPLALDARPTVRCVELRPRPHAHAPSARVRACARRTRYFVGSTETATACVYVTSTLSPALYLPSCACRSGS
jgi:hypothetical protein